MSKNSKDNFFIDTSQNLQSDFPHSPKGVEQVEFFENKSKKRNHQQLRKLIKDKVIASSEDFTPVQQKTEGASEGGIERRDGKLYMVKPVRKGRIEDKTQVGNKDDILAELMTASLYKRFLYDRAPIVGIAKNDAQESDYVSSTSEFIEGFKSLKELRLTPEQKSLLKGFEKVVTVSTFLGDGDYHSENIGAVRSNNEEDHYLHAVKIDHGRSRIYPSSEKDLRRRLSSYIEKWNYQDMPLNVEEFIVAVNEVNKISTEEIEDFIRNSAYKIKSSGLTPNPRFAGESMRTNSEVISTAKLEQFYISKLSKQKEIFEEFKSTLEIISKIDAPLEWKNGKWLTDIREQDPIEWLKNNNLTIEGLSADEWKLKNPQYHISKNPSQNSTNRYDNFNTKLHSVSTPLSPIHIPLNSAIQQKLKLRGS